MKCVTFQGMDFRLGHYDYYHPYPLTAADDITRDGGLQPDVSCSDFPKAGPPSPDNDACILAAAAIIQRAPPAEPLFVSRTGMALVE